MCDCCDPTSDSPDPVVVRLEREVDDWRLACEKAARERDEWKAACQTQFKVNVDTPLFSGLAGGSFAPGVLLASLHAVTAERNELRAKLAAAEAALARIALSETGDKCWSDFAQDFLGWKSTSELWDVIKAAKAGGCDE